MQDRAPYAILIVDDEASNLQILNQFLKERYTVYAARSGAAALRIAAQKKPDLILLDIILPDMNGYQVLETLKGADATRNTPVVFISGLSGDEEARKGLSLGAAGYITKPFSGARVRAEVEALLDSNG